MKYYYLIGSFVLVACGTETPESHSQSVEVEPITRQAPVDTLDETAEMVQRLQDLVTNGDPHKYYHWNAKRAEFYGARLNEGSQQQRMHAWFSYCKQLLRSGDAKGCIEQIESYLHSLNVPYEQALTDNNKVLFDLLALAYLIKGENENCQNAHTAESCILPLQSGGIHQLPTGSTVAKEIYELLNQKYPSPKYSWLINLAAMTLDKYPDEVEESDLLTFPNWNMEQQNFPRFEEVAMNVGLAQNGLSGGTCVEDFNGDGHLDVFATSYGMEDQAKLFLSDGKGGYEDHTDAYGLTGIVSGLNCLHADYDNDGWVDILILRGAWLQAGGEHPNSLLKNMEGKGFKDVTRSSGVLSFHPTQTADWADYDQDGDLDLFIGNETARGTIHPCELYQNQGDGTFVEVANQVGLATAVGFVKGCAWGDVNNDGWPDLYISLLGGPNMLFQNITGRFTPMATVAGVAQPFFGFPCWFWDVNNDGLLDLFVSRYDLRKLDNLAEDYAIELAGQPAVAETPRLYINKGDFKFEDGTEQYRLNRVMYSMGSNFGDLDNDGFLDFYVGTGAPDLSTVVPNRMFRNVGGTRFEEVTSAGNFGHIQKGHLTFRGSRLGSLRFSAPDFQGFFVKSNFVGYV